jgi:ferredoxin
MKVFVDRARCTGHGLCLLHAPDIFDHDDTGLAVVLQEEPDDPAAAREAEQNCPERAIRLEESE